MRTDARKHCLSANSCMCCYKVLCNCLNIFEIGVVVLKYHNNEIIITFSP